MSRRSKRDPDPWTPDDDAILAVSWPDDMPDFEDHPRAAPPGSLAKAARLGSRFESAGRKSESSAAGSTIDGAAFHPTGRRVGEKR